jgi:two-component system OmpR family response regulator
MVQKYLLIEDDEDTAKLVLRGLLPHNYDGDLVHDGPVALQRLRLAKYDFIILDVSLPSGSGLDLMRDIRAIDSEIPIIFLSGMTSTEDRIRGLECGAEDYICKPFSRRELVLRIQKIMRSQEKSSVVSFGDIKLDRLKRTIIRGQQTFEVQEREFLLLELFLLNPDKIVSKKQILKDICGYNFVPNTNIIDVLICRLREKISTKEGLVTIRTIRGVGYKIHIEPRANVHVHDHLISLN